MNIILISDDPRESDLLKHELAMQAPAIRMDISHNTQDAMARLAASAPCDAILLDASVLTADAFNLVTTIRQEKKPIGIVSLVSTAEKNPPIDLFKAGVDNFVLKRAGFVSLLQDALHQAKERHQANPNPHTRQVRLLFAGDIQFVKKNASSLPRMAIEPVSFSPDGMLKLPETGTLQDEVLVIDYAAAGANTFNAIKDVSLRIPDIPIILLTNSGDEETAIQAMRAGASDCIAKTDNCFQRLVPIIERENKRRELARVRSALRSREERLRQIVETMPVGITVMASDGTFLAVNRAGLSLMGAARLEQIIGKSFFQLLPQEEREKVTAFFATISKGNGASIRIHWSGLDGTIPGIELRAVPMRRDSAGTTAALAAVYPLDDARSGPAAIEEEAQQKRQDLEKALQESETGLRDLQSRHDLQQSKWAEVLQQAESRCTEALEQQAILASAAQEAEARYQKLLEEQAEERANWEQAREDLREQCAKIESMAESLRSTQESLLESQAAERAQWESKIQELAHKRQDSEAQFAQLSETLSAERSQWDTARHELEQKARSAESGQASIQSALGDAETRLAYHAEGLTADKSQWETIRQELEQKAEDAQNLRAALQDALRSAEDGLARQAEERNAEKSHWDALRQELEQKTQEIESQRAALESALRDSEARFAQHGETLTAEQSQWDALRQELEQKAQETESQRAALESALRDSEARFAQHDETLAAERSQWDSLRQELEQKAQETESQRAALESALRDSEARFAQHDETVAAERSQWDSLRQELEQKARDIEAQRASLESALRDSEARFAQHDETLASRTFPVGFNPPGVGAEGSGYRSPAGFIGIRPP